LQDASDNQWIGAQLSDWLPWVLLADAPSQEYDYEIGGDANAQ
jgi:hypothetical protein